jgi:pyruvate oxidase
VGAIAASVDAKLTGKIGVCFGSAGPGATHLFNGLYDAQLDHAPVLAIIGQVASTAMNYDSFQELNENPMFANVSIYNRTVMTPESLPHITDEAVRRAYKHKGVAVITIPVNFGLIDIDEGYFSSAINRRESTLMPDLKDISEAITLISKAKRPVLYVGQGIKSASQEAIELAKHYSMPIISSVMTKGIIPDDTANYMGTAARVASKPANEALSESDLILFTGSDFPFAKFFFPKNAKFIQIDTDSSKLGKRHKTDVAILANAKETMKLLKVGGKAKPAGRWYNANIKNRKNWQEWLQSFSGSNAVPLRPEPVFKEINRIADDDAIFITDVGNVTIFAVRMLKMNGKQKFSTSGFFCHYGVRRFSGSKRIHSNKKRTAKERI